jgi:Mrp family chromosome partitioning ATPase
MIRCAAERSPRLQVPVLAVVPYMETIRKTAETQDRVDHDRALALGLVVLVLVHFSSYLWTFFGSGYASQGSPRCASGSSPRETVGSMERIRDAVERARQERAARGTGSGGASTSVFAPVGAHDVAGEIAYTATRTVDAPRTALKERRIVSGFDPCGFTEAFKILSTQVSQTLREQRWTSLAVTSPGVGEGKTLVAINLAISLAMEFHQTSLLVDADLRQPSVRDYFGLEPGPGLSDYLTGDTPIEQLSSTQHGNFVLLRDTAIAFSEILGSRKMTQLVRELKDRYSSSNRVFDLPPCWPPRTFWHLHRTSGGSAGGRGGQDEDRRCSSRRQLLSSTHLIGTV